MICSLPTLTMPFWTLKPSWYLRSGLRISTMVTGGHLTMFILILDWDFRPWKTKTTNLVVICKQNVEKLT